MQTAISIDDIMKEVDDGYVNAQVHPSGKLCIFNYSQRAQFDWRWNDVTRQCRGLIMDREHNVVARPFPKFFAVDQMTEAVPAEPFEVFEKLDGSLGILYWLDDEPHIATRGSFTSEQALIATSILRNRYSHVSLDRSLTYLFEIVYPTNRIVVDYGDTEDLFLLCAIETATGQEQGLPDIGFPMVARHDGLTDFDLILQEQDTGREGYVIRFESGLRVKIKFEEYKRLHKLLTGINARHIWDILRNDGDLSEVIDRVPDEFHQWVRETENDLRYAFASVEAECRRHMIFHGPRRDIAAQFKLCRHPGVMFMMLDGKDYRDQIWKIIRPECSTAFRPSL